MPDRAVNTGHYISFVESSKESLNFGKSASRNAILNTLLMVSVTNSYVEGSSHLTGISGQTVRNHLRDKNPKKLLRINDNLIATMRDKGILRKPLKVAIDWHDEMYYGNIETGYRMIRKFLARTISRRLNVRLLYFYLAILLYNIWIILNIVLRVIIIADNLRIFMASILIKVNPFSTNPVQSNSHSGSDFDLLLTSRL